MRVGLLRSLQPPDIIWIHWRVYNFIANTNERLLFLPSSDAYVRSFLCLLYTLIKLYYTKSLSNQALSLTSDWILLLQGPRILGSWLNNNLSMVCQFYLSSQRTSFGLCWFFLRSPLFLLYLFLPLKICFLLLISGFFISNFSSCLSVELGNLFDFFLVSWDCLHCYESYP